MPKNPDHIAIPYSSTSTLLKVDIGRDGNELREYYDEFPYLRNPRKQLYNRLGLLVNKYWEPNK